MTKFSYSLSVFIGMLLGLLVMFHIASYMLGFYPNALGIELAAKLIKENQPPEKCLNIIHPIPHIFSPSASEQRYTCLYYYAKFSMDASACNLLPDGNYKKQCIENFQSH